ncbi:MAG: hypothetical protein J2P26_00290 [Nocardiopsaceae bacterium]|nr:hypothetical protein [Nocardiopsaceae bacterium]
MNPDSGIFDRGISDSGISDRGIVETGQFDRADFAEELRRAPDNHELGTALLFANERVRVFEVRLEPGQRGAFHIHDRDYFWTVVEPGRGLQRLADGTWAVRDYQLGQTRFLRHGPDSALIHDLENVGSTTLRFVTVELADTGLTDTGLGDTGSPGAPGTGTPGSPGPGRDSEGRTGAGAGGAA